jgi:hypothetical protein
VALNCYVSDEDESVTAVDAVPATKKADKKKKGARKGRGDADSDSDAAEAAPAAAAADETQAKKKEKKEKKKDKVNPCSCFHSTSEPGNCPPMSLTMLCERDIRYHPWNRGYCSYPQNLVQ